MANTVSKKTIWSVVGVLMLIIACAFAYGRYSNMSELEAIAKGKTSDGVVPQQTVEAVKQAADDADDSATAADKAAKSARVAADSTRETAKSAEGSARDASASANDAAANVNTNDGGQAGNNNTSREVIGNKK